LSGNPIDREEVGGETALTANPVQTTAIFGVKQWLPVDGVERMKNNAETTHHASYDKLMD
jgi:hypothetical protein